MPVYIENIEFVPDNVASPTFTDYLKGNIYQKIDLRIQFRSELWINFDSLNIQFADLAFKSDDWITSPSNLNGFNGFNVDDVVVVTGTSGNNNSYIISEKISNNQMRLVDLLGGAVTLTRNLEITGRISLKQDPTGVTLDFGLIENSEVTNFDSKVTQDLMRFEISVLSGPLSASLLPMLGVGLKDWQLGSGNLRNLTTGGERDNQTYIYELNQVLFIHPFYLPNQFLNLTNKFPIQPKYFRKENCLKYTARIRAYREIQDPNVFQEGIIQEQDGQTGWFNEEFNGGTSLYKAENLTYDNSIQALDIRRNTRVTFDIIADASLAAAPYYVYLNFIILPEEDNDFKRRNQLQAENFVFDRAEQFRGGTIVNGENFGTGYQVFKDVTVTAKTANSVEVSAYIDFGSDAIDKINTLSDGGYQIAAYTNMGPSETADQCHFTTMLIDVNNVQTEVTDTIVAITTDLIRHDKNNLTNFPASNNLKVEDEIVAESLILIDHTATTGFPSSQIDTLSSQIVAKKTGEADVILLNEDFSLIGQPLIGAVRDISTNPTTGFNVNPTEIRANFRAYRSRADDTGLKYGYRVQFPFLYRWEYWQQLLLTSPPNDFYDALKEFNGYNENWIRLEGLTGWSIEHRLQATVTFSGVQKKINHDELIPADDYLANTDWINEEIQSFDGVTQISYLTDPYIIKNKKTTIKASFEYNGTDTILDTDVYFVARLIPKENGTFISNETLSSVWNRETAGGLFLGDSNGLITVTKVGSVFTGTFDINNDNLATGILDYTLSVSINRNSTTALIDFGEIQKKDLKVLEIIDFNPPIVPKDENPFEKCCYPFQVLADLSDPDDIFRNDFNSPIKIFPLQYSVTMFLENLIDGVWGSPSSTPITLNNNDLGTYYALGFKSKNYYNYVGYRIDWAKVLDDTAFGFGPGNYRIKFQTPSGSLYSNEYCLNQFTTLRSDETVRFEYTLNSLIGDENQKRIRDFVDVNWTDQLRIDNAIFGSMSASFSSDSVKYENGNLQAISKGFEQSFICEFRILPLDQLIVLLHDVLMADNIKVSDYNRKGLAPYSNFEVEIAGSLEPSYEGNRAETAVTSLIFKSSWENNNKFYS
jgi:hypothetical protein